MLIGRVVKSFLDGGGTLQYEATFDSGGRRIWTVRGVATDGTLHPIYVSATGEPREFRSANALMNYHREMVPGATEVSIPLHTEPEPEPAKNEARRKRKRST